MSTASNAADITRIVMMTIDKDLSHNYTLPISMSSGHFLVHVIVYGLELDGTLSRGINYPAVALNFITSGSNQDGNDYVGHCLALHAFLVLTGIHLEANYSMLRSCHINSSFRFIWAECMYPSNSRGFQVLAQLNEPSQVHKLFSGKAISPQTSVAIPVEEEGLYQITIMAIRWGTGVVGSNVEYRKTVIIADNTNSVNDDVITTGTKVY